MTHLSRIIILGLLIATHAVAVPLHVAIDHAPHAHIDHAEATHDHPHPHDHGPNTAADHHHPSPPHETCQSGHEPHDHGVHAHGETDHGYFRPRTAAAPTFLVAVVDSFDDAPRLPRSTFVDAAESPPHAAPCLHSPSLRAPPVS